MMRERRRLIRDIQAAGFNEEQTYDILDQFYLARPGDVWDFIASHYPVGAAA